MNSAQRQINAGANPSRNRAETGADSLIMQQCLTPFSAAIQDWRASAAFRKQSGLSPVIETLAPLDSGAIASITLKRIILYMMAGMPLEYGAKRITDSLLDELDLTRAASTDSFTLSDSQKRELGNLLIELAIISTGVCMVQTLECGQGKSISVIQPSFPVTVWLWHGKDKLNPPPVGAASH